MIRSSGKTYPRGYFYAASLALMLTGAFFAPDLKGAEILLLAWLTVFGTFFIYGLKALILKEGKTIDNIRKYISGKPVTTTTISTISLIMALLYVPAFRLAVLASIAFLGISYTSKMVMSDRTFSIRTSFLLKNLVIGVGWGALVWVGYGSWSSGWINALFFFTTLQVVVGSIIRDIEDIDGDKRSNPSTLPVRLGKLNTLIFCHAVNVLSLSPFLVIGRIDQSLIPFFIVILWRSALLIRIGSSSNTYFWTQTMNLFTCVLIFVAVMIGKFYGIF